MSDNTAALLAIFILFGWIPILSIGKAIAMIIEATKDDYEYIDNNKEQQENDK